jgi:uncharacterized membrane protein SpoIIM required for sporulation
VSRDYAHFVTTRGPDWAALEAALARAHKHGLRALSYAEVEALVAGHQAVVGDLAWAQVAFPGTALVGRLGRLAAGGHALLVRPGGPAAGRLRAWVVSGHARDVRAAAAELAIAAATMLAGGLFGAVLVSAQPDAVGLFLGDDALAGLRRGEVWTDGVEAGLDLSAFIGTNNAGVGLRAWAGGLLLGLGSLFVLLFNGAMLGAVVVEVARHGLGHRLLDWVAAHGPLELSLIAVCGGAGLVLGRGLVDPRGASRAETLRAAARQSLSVALGTVPWFAVLGVVEGLVSPRDDLPLAAKAGLGALLWLVYAAWVARPLPPAPSRPESP